MFDQRFLKISESESSRSKRSSERRLPPIKNAEKVEKPVKVSEDGDEDEEQ
jgi:hypothetical protein